ncbi:MAG TPA: SWIM zinc finger family protein [Acidobacteriaceae bacterium]|jgi:hypothetical protein
MALTLDRIEALAPDQPSLVAARKLLKPASWPTLAESDGLAWGECQGSGATPYRVVIAEADGGYKCTCPSRKFPCKHALALMWMRAEGKPPFTPAAPPEWVKDWLSRRRNTATGPAAKEEAEGEEKPKASIRLAKEHEEPAKDDPKAEARAAAARERNRQEREISVLAGLDDLDVWLNDQVQRGMAAFVAQSSASCRTIAQRLVDAKAQGIASRLEALPTRLFTLPENARSQAAIEELGQIHLIASAYRRAADLPSDLIADVRQAAGWNVTREALIADASARRVSGTWRVVANITEVQPDRLRRVETWLWLESASESNSRFAVLIDFVPVATGAASSGYLTGDRIQAELVYYPSPLPMRAQIMQISSGAQPSREDLQLAPDTLTAAYAGYERALAQLPWLKIWPLAFQSGHVRRSHDALYLCDAERTLALPLHTSQATTTLPLLSVGALNGIGLWDGYQFMLTWAQTELGRWVHA